MWRRWQTVGRWKSCLKRSNQVYIQEPRQGNPMLYWGLFKCVFCYVNKIWVCLLQNNDGNNYARKQHVWIPNSRLTVALGLITSSPALLPTSIFDCHPLTQTMIPMSIPDTVFHVASLIDLRPDTCYEMCVCILCDLLQFLTLIGTYFSRGVHDIFAALAHLHTKK